MNEHLKIINDWLKSNQVSLNKRKTVYITFANGIDMLPIEPKVLIDTIEIERVESTKYLGIILDQHLKWNYHITNIAKRTRYWLFIFSKLK